MRSLADEDLEPLIRMVREERGVDLSSLKDKYLRRRISVRLRASGAHNLKHYIKILHQDTDEYRAFLDALTINTSAFFRNRECFRVIADTIMPEVADFARDVGHRPPWIWSVGCARGEEAYSLAMLGADQHLPSFGRVPAILATDIDQNAIDDGALGTYGRRSTSEMTPSEVEARFDVTASRVTVPAALRAMVSFRRHDILEDPPRAVSTSSCAAT